MKAKTNNKSILSEQESGLVYIPASLYAQVMSYVLSCNIEVSGMGQVQPHADGVMVTKVHLLKQECSGSETTLDEDELAELYYECEDGKYKDYGELVWWWHSHVNMGVFWSGTDQSAIAQLSEDGRIYATVFNKKFESRTAYRQGSQEVDGFFYPDVMIDQQRLVIVPDDEYLREVEAKVQREVYQPAYYGGTYQGGNWYAGKPVQSTQQSLASRQTNLLDTVDREDKLISSLSEKCNISTILAADILDEYLELFGKTLEAVTTIDLTQYYKINYQGRVI
jgi:hypothetical protein